MTVSLLAALLLAAAPVQQSAYRRSPYVGAVSVNAQTAKVIYSSHPEAKAYPASVTKLMTALLVLEDVKSGRYRLEDVVSVTAEVYKSEPSWMGLKAGDRVTVESLLIALLVESANDAAIALAVNASGSLSAFVERMNARAAELGMASTVYYNPNGLPPNPARRYPWKNFNVTTAADQVKLALELVNRNPKILEYTSVKTAALIRTADGFRVVPTRRSDVAGATEVTLAAGEKIEKTMVNHNNVMVKDKSKVFNPDGREAVDGLKTGYINAGGSSVILTGRRQGKRAVVVVLGSSSSGERDTHAALLMTDALGVLEMTDALGGLAR